MNEQIKTKWLEALESGKYQQGREKLRRNNSFCCLGVLADLYAQETGKEWSEPVFNGVRIFEGSSGLCPNIVSEWAGFSLASRIGQDPELPFHDREGDIVSLAILNDIGFTFSQLSDLIKAFL